MEPFLIHVKLSRESCLSQHLAFTLLLFFSSLPQPHTPPALRFFVHKENLYMQPRWMYPCSHADVEIGPLHRYQVLYHCHLTRPLYSGDVDWQRRAPIPVRVRRENAVVICWHHKCRYPSRFFFAPFFVGWNGLRNRGLLSLGRAVAGIVDEVVMTLWCNAERGPWPF